MASPTPLMSAANSSPVPMPPESPMLFLDDSLRTMRDIAGQVQNLQQQQEESELKVIEAQNAHRATQEKLMAAEAERAAAWKAREVAEQDNNEIQKKLSQEEKLHARARDALQSSMEDLANNKMVYEAMRLEMEAKNKVFAVHVNLAAKHAELEAAYFTKNDECDQLRAQHTPMKAALDVAREKAAALDEIKSKAAEEAMGKVKHKQRALVALERSLATNDNGLMSSVLTSWLQVRQQEELMRQKKDQSMQRVLRAIGGQTLALLQEVHREWDKITDKARRDRLLNHREDIDGNAEDAAAEQQKAQKAKTMKQMERQLGNSAKALSGRIFELWQGVRPARLKKEKGKGAAIRNIADSAGALMAQTVQAWQKVTLESRKRKLKKDQGMQRSLRLIADSDRALKSEVFAPWMEDVIASKKTRLAKDSGNAKAVRMISGSQDAMKKAVTLGWATTVKNLREKGNKMKMVERTLIASANGILAIVVQAWHGFAAKSTVTKHKKSQSMARATRDIANSKNAIMDMCFSLWDKLTKANRGQRASEAAEELKKALESSGKNEETLLKSLQEATGLKVELEALKKSNEELNARIVAAEALAATRQRAFQEREMQFTTACAEIDQSRRKARDIKDELAKVEHFLTPRTRNSRPSSGMKRGSNPDGSALPRIDRPHSARGSKGRAFADAAGKGAALADAAAGGARQPG